MKISIQWLRDYVDLPADKTPAQIAHELTMSTVEVEQVEDLSQGLAHIFAARVRACEPHPDADKLQIVTCDLGEQGERRVVCGGTNVVEGMTVALGLPGAVVTGRDGQPFTLAPTSVRGVPSGGMICSAGELGLSELLPSTGDKHIIDLEGWEAEPGQPLAGVLGYDDVVLEIDNKSLTNRPDLWSHHGIARELAALYDRPLAEVPTATLPEATGELSVQIEAPEHCYRYTATRIEGATVAPSPAWMRSRLARIGIRPINNLVDLTNYVMAAVGQPSHAFDARDVQRGIVVRHARAGESLTLLDGSSHALTDDTLVIAEAERPVALAGVMGGDLGVRDDTTALLLEIASFEPVGVRRTGRRFGLRTESSSRFEKGIDTARVELALGALLQLLGQICPGASVTAHLDAFPTKPEPVSVSVGLDYIRGRLGEALPDAQICGLLDRLGFDPQPSGDQLTVAVPAWRATGDVSIPADIVEEVARLHGYANLAFRPPIVALDAPILQPRVRLERRLKEALALRHGMREVWSYPWVGDRYLEAAGCPTPPLALAHPPAPDTARLQPSLVPQVLRVIADNLRFFSSFRVFELNRVFPAGDPSPGPGGQDQLPRQAKRLVGALVGEDPAALFLQAKGIVEGLPRAVQIGALSLGPGEAPWADPAGCLAILRDGAQIGVLGVLSARTCNRAGIRGHAALFELDVEALEPHASRENRFEALPEYPEVDYDISMLVDRSVSWARTEALVAGVDPLIRRVSFIEEYTGPQVGEGKKSLTLRMILGSSERTLVREEVDAVAERVVQQIGEQLGATVR